MRFSGIARVLATAGLGSLLMLGCATTTHTGQTGDASTPQEKVHRDQLAEMGRQDGKSAGTNAKKPDAPRPETGRRRSGQGVIDQPIRP